jgi:hypothetical protein
LLSHMVSLDARRALCSGDLAGFLERRERDLREYIGDFLDRQAEWEPADRDRPALTSLVVPD